MAEAACAMVFDPKAIAGHGSERTAHTHRACYLAEQSRFAFDQLQDRASNFGLPPVGLRARADRGNFLRTGVGLRDSDSVQI